MKINQELVTQTFNVRLQNAGIYYEQDDVDHIKTVVHQLFGVTLSNSETIDFWKWRCNEWDGSWFGVDPERDSDLIQEYFQKFIEFVGVEPDEDEDEEKEEYSEPPTRVGVKVVVKDAEGIPWEIEMDPHYHTQLISDIESQIPEKSEGGSIRYSLEYDSSKIWNMRKLEACKVPQEDDRIEI